MDRGFVDSHLMKAMGSARDDVEIVPIQDKESTISTIDNPLWDAISDSIDDLDGHRNLLPSFMNVATDARFWRPRGTIAYGVGRFDDRMTFSEMLSLFHGHDERVSVRVRASDNRALRSGLTPVSPALIDVVCDLDGVIYRGDTLIPGADGRSESARLRGRQPLICDEQLDKNAKMK